MKPLTKREKVLLYILAVMAVVAGVVVLLIQPAMTRADQLDAEILEKQMSVDQIKASLLTQKSLEDQIAANEAGIDEERKFFLPVMTNNELDAYITGLLQSHGLTAISLAISSPAESTDDAAVPVDSDIQQYLIVTTARGTMRQFMLLADTVKELDGVRITAVSNKQDEKRATPTPSPTPKPNKKSKATPVPILSTPTPAAQEGTYTMNITFAVMEYTEGASTSVTLNRAE